MPMPNLAQAIQILNNLKTVSSDPTVIVKTMMENNPSFRSFMEANEGKSPEQIAQENGIDLNQIMSLFK